MDTTHLVCLYLLAKLLQAELEKCLRLVTNLPMQDMETYLGKIECHKKHFCQARRLLPLLLQSGQCQNSKNSNLRLKSQKKKEQS